MSAKNGDRIEEPAAVAARAAALARAALIVAAISAALAILGLFLPIG